MAGEVPVIDEEAHLLAWVRDRDVPCPVCGYNLRDLTQPVCPECRHDVHLTVGVLQPRLGWLFVALAPAAFSGIAAALLLIPIVGSSLMTREYPPWPILAVDAFGWLSALAGLVLFRRRNAFLRRSAAVQSGWALGVWGIHLAAFALFVAAMSLI
jgi:hypothetical protein